MSQVTLELNLESYFFSRGYKSIYFSGKLINNIIFDNEIIEEKSARVKVILKSENLHSILQILHQNILAKNCSKFVWPVKFQVDITSITKPLNKDGVRISTFQALKCEP